jgi:threonine synthase
MAQFAEKGAFTLSSEELAAMRALFVAHRCDEAETQLVMRRTYEATGYLPDPHSAVGIAAAEREVEASHTPMIALATAHPAKFPDAAEQAIERRPEPPAKLEAILAGREAMLTVEPRADAVRRLITDRGRFTSKEGRA